MDTKDKETADWKVECERERGREREGIKEKREVTTTTAVNNVKTRRVLRTSTCQNETLTTDVADNSDDDGDDKQVTKK